jgi:ABC-type phosphate transport system substrate-binding protein
LRRFGESRQQLRAPTIVFRKTVTRDQIRIVGSSTVFPYTQAVAEEFANQGGVSPVVESTGTGGGFQIFCGGVGVDHPDMTGASRAMRKSEWDLCVAERRDRRDRGADRL